MSVTFLHPCVFHAHSINRSVQLQFPFCPYFVIIDLRALSLCKSRTCSDLPNLVHMHLMLLLLWTPALSSLDRGRPAIRVAHASVGAGLGGWRSWSCRWRSQLVQNWKRVAVLCTFWGRGCVGCRDCCWLAIHCERWYYIEELGCRFDVVMAMRWMLI